MIKLPVRSNEKSEILNMVTNKTSSLIIIVVGIFHPDREVTVIEL